MKEADMRYLGEAELTQIMGIGHLGEVRQGPDGNLYQWTQGVDGLGNPVGFWRKALKRLGRRVVRGALPLFQQVAPLIPGVGPAAAALRIATPLLRQAAPVLQQVAPADATAPPAEGGTAGWGLGALYQAPDGALYQVQGFADDADLQPFALQRLELVLERATAGKRWGHVIESQLLQALAYQMLQEEAQALDILSEAVKLAEPEGYIRSFVDEGTSMEALLYRLRKQRRKQGPTPYLDRLLAAFQQESRAHMQPRGQTQAQPLSDPLSEREREVLQLIARGASNQEIGRELVIVSDTVKRHVSHIFTKLGVQNRVRAVKQARELGLLGEED
jgi:DNA-binding CsgD family transcriptional regulator